MTTDPGAPPPRPRRLGRVLWRIGWVLLALVSFSVTYAVLVVGGH
jgi:hypothetical protein